MTATETLLALAVAVGLVGIVVPVLPGSLLILGALLVWAGVTATATAWVVFAVGAILLGLGAIARFLIPGRRLAAAGVPRRALVIGGLAGLVGFFVVPVVGLFLGFFLGVYLYELSRVGSSRAMASTWMVTKAAGLSLLVELTAGLAAAAAFVVGVLAT